VEDRPGPDLDPRRPDRATHPTRGLELDPLPGTDLALHLPLDLQEVDVDGGLDPGGLPDDEALAADARAL